MKNILLLKIIFFFASCGAFAQSDFRDGFIITLGKDTVYGQVDYRSNTKSYKSVRLKKETTIREYTPQQIAGFGYNGDKAFTSGILEGCFVEVLVRGVLSLYKYELIYLVRKEEGEVHKLESKEVKVEVDGKVRVKEDNRWKGILVNLLSDCFLNFNHLVENLRMHEKPLTNLVVQYNKCKGSYFTVYKENKPWTKVDLGVAVGVTMSTIKIAPVTFLDDTYHSVDPGIGLVLEVSSPRISEKVAFQPELHFTRSKYSALVVVKNSFETIYHDTYIDLATLSLPISIKYSIPVRKSFFCIQGGSNFDYHLIGSTRLLTENVRNNVVDTSPERSAFEVNSYQFGFFGGVGLSKSFHNFRGSVAIRYFKMLKLNATEWIEINNNKLALSIIISRK